MSKCHSTPHSSGKGKRLSGDALIAAALEIVANNYLIFKNPQGVAHAVIPQDARASGYRIVQVRSPYCIGRIARAVHECLGQRLSDAVRKEIVTAILDQATDADTPTEKTYQRIARTGVMPGHVFIDLADQAGSVVMLTRDGYQRCAPGDHPPLVRTPGMQPLPDPTKVKGDLDLLWDFLNLANESDRRLILVFLLYYLGGQGPFPILLVNGVAGSSKSTFCRILGRLIDPTKPEIVSLPRNERELAIAANNSYLLIFDNLRKLTPEMSDALCRIATGGGYRARQLYSDQDEVLFDATRPMILNGIHDFADQPDLLDRAMRVELPAIDPSVREAEADVWAAFEKDYARIFAGLLDALSLSLRKLPAVRDVESPIRMADFFRFGCAVEVAMGWPEGSFEKIILANRKWLMADSTADDHLTQAMLALAKNKLPPGGEVRYTAVQMLHDLCTFVDERVLSNAKLWPSSPNALGKRLRTLESPLRSQGVEVKFRHSGSRHITLRRL